jgi:hypothetical protein
MLRTTLDEDEPPDPMLVTGVAVMRIQRVG